MFLAVGVVLLSVSTFLGAPLIGIGATLVLLGAFCGFLILFRGKVCADCSHKWVERLRESSQA